MVRCALLLAALIAFAAPGAAQIHAINANGFTFNDSVSGTNVTTVNWPVTITWVNITGTHTVTSGTGSTDPNSGALFNAPLDNTANPTFTWTPPAPGTYSYYCIPHELFGMIGTIHVIGPPSNFPGTGEDLEMGMAVNTPGVLPLNAPNMGGFADTKTANPGDVVTLEITSPGGGFDWEPLAVVGHLFNTGGLPPFQQLPGLWVNATGAIFLVNPFGVMGFNPVVAPPTVQYHFVVPGGLSGQSTIVQAIALTPTALNGILAAADAQVVEFN